MRFLCVAGLILGLTGPALAEGEPVPPTKAPAADASAKPAPPSPTVPPTSDRFVFVPSGVDRTIGFLSQLQPDCTSLGSIDYRIEAKPQHGTVTFQPGENFPTYPMNSLMQHCNDKKWPGLFTHYISAEGYVGEDHVDVLYLLPSASALQIRYTIIVK